MLVFGALSYICYKRAQVLPLLKKAGLDSSSPANYRPISNLPTMSKILERLVQSRLRPHLCNSDNFSEYPSAYRTGHSTETALLEVLDGVYTSADDKQISVLIGLDLSAAFDTVDHSLLCDRLQSQFSVTDTALDWLRSYLSDRAQYVKIGQHQSDIVRLEVGVPQGSVLSPAHCCSLCSAVRCLTSSHSTASSFTSTPTTHSFNCPCTPTTASTVWLSSLPVLLTSGIGTCRMAYSLIRRNLRVLLSGRPVSCKSPCPTCRPCPSPVSIYRKRIR